MVLLYLARTISGSSFILAQRLTVWLALILLAFRLDTPAQNLSPNLARGGYAPACAAVRGFRWVFTHLVS